MTRHRPRRPEYVPPCEWWPLLGASGVLLGATTHGVAALFGLAGILALILWAVRWLRHHEHLCAQQPTPAPPRHRSRQPAAQPPTNPRRRRNRA